MKIYLLKQKSAIMLDEMAAVVVRAESEEIAREYANAAAKDEGPIWTDSSKTSCEVLDYQATPGVILADVFES